MNEGMKSLPNFERLGSQAFSALSTPPISRIGAFSAFFEMYKIYRLCTTPISKFQQKLSQTSKLNILFRLFFSNFHVFQQFVSANSAIFTLMVNEFQISRHFPENANIFRHLQKLCQILRTNLPQSRHAFKKPEINSNIVKLFIFGKKCIHSPL